MAQLLADIDYVREHPPQIYREAEEDIFEWLPPDEDEQQAPKKTIEEWTGIKQYALPPADRLKDRQLSVLLESLKELLAVYNCHFVLLVEVPERIQYQALRRGWFQISPMTRFHEHHFSFCNKEENETGCHLGNEYCHCRIIDEMFPKSYTEEEWTEADEERFWNRQNDRKRDEGSWLFDLDDDEF
ncbi:MAG: hypothetical protein AB8G22_23150 [Saprospiraceae bacterium]